MKSKNKTYQTEDFNYASGTNTSLQTSSEISFDEGYDFITGVQLVETGNSQPVTYDNGFLTNKGKNMSVVPSDIFKSSTSVAQEDRWFPVMIPTKGCKLRWQTQLDTALSGHALNFKVIFRLESFENE